jgi:hypothetical protein
MDLSEWSAFLACADGVLTYRIADMCGVPTFRVEQTLLPLIEAGLLDTHFRVTEAGRTEIVRYRENPSAYRMPRAATPKGIP